MKLINKNLIFLLLIVVFALFLRLPQILADQIPFAFDMGRDMIWAQNLILFKDFFLIVVGAFVIVVASSYYPAKKASEVDILTVLRNE